MPRYEEKFALQNLGLIHFLIVSGAHVQFIASFFDFLIKSVQENLNQSAKPLKLLKFVSLSLLCLSTSFSAPVLRAVTSFLVNICLRKTIHKTPSKALKSLLVIFIVAPISFFKNQTLSFLLSMTFSFICSLCFSKSKIKTALFIYLLSMPVFLSLFDCPEWISIFLNPFFGFLFAFILLPLSFLSLFSNQFETLVINIWWLNLDFLKEVSIFLDLNIYEKQVSSFKTSFCYFYFLILFCVELFLRPLWIRRNKSFSS